MGKVADQMNQLNYQNWAIIGLLALLSVGMLFPGALNSLQGDQSDLENKTKFDQISYDDYPVALNVPDNATVYMVSSDVAEEDMPDAYGDYTSSESDMDSDVNDLDKGEEYYVTSNGQFDAGEVPSGQYRVAVYSNGNLNYFATESVPSEIAKFRYEQDNPVDVVQDSDLTEMGTFAVKTSDVTGEVEESESYADDGESMTETTTLEVSDGTVLLGEVAPSNLHSNVTDVTLSVVSSDGTTVYEQSDDVTDGVDFDELMVADGESARTDSYDSDTLAQNPVMEDGEFTVEVEAEFEEGTDLSQVSDVADVAVEDLFGASETVNVEVG